VLGAPVVIHSKSGPIEGVIGKKPIHLQTGSEKATAPLLGDVWIDIGAKDREDAQKAVELGDYVTFKLGVTQLWNNCIAGPGLDNKAGLFVALEALRLCAGAALNVALYAVSTVQEEVGLRGASTATAALSPEIGLAIDVTLASDDPGTDSVTIVPCQLGCGPCISHGPNTNPVIERMLLDAAQRAKLPYQRAASGDLDGNDAKQIQITGAGVATATIGIPQRNMHTQAEVVNLDDLDNAAHLVAEFVKSIAADTDFRPLYFKECPARERHARR
jgi:tetrahedral aminopeptidase